MYKKKYNRIFFEFNWVKGVKINIPHNKFVSICLGIFILLLGAGYFSEHFIKAIAPQGFFMPANLDKGK